MCAAEIGGAGERGAAKGKNPSFPRVICKRGVQGMRCYYREKKYICGSYVDVQVYPVYAKAGKRRSKAKPTSEVQEKLNAENSKKKFTRLVHTNFTEKDVALHLTYDKANMPSDAERARKDGQNFLRQLKRLYKKAGLELKYVWVCEIGKRSGRIHHHLIISGGVSRDVTEALWGKGYANSKRLQFTENGLRGLSAYFVKQQLFFKRWSASRNLIQPKEQVSDYSYSAREVREIVKFGDVYSFAARYEGLTVTDIEFTQNEHNGGFYISAEFFDAGKGVTVNGV